MGTCSCLGLGVFFGVVFADGGFGGPFEHMVEEAEEAEFQIRLVDILAGGERLLALVAFNEALQLLLGSMFFQVGKDHFHLFTPFMLILTCEG
jgi:hypothetical protein